MSYLPTTLPSDGTILTTQTGKAKDGGYRSKAEQIKRQRMMADYLRKQYAEAPQGTTVRGTRGTALFGDNPDIYVAPSWTQNAAHLYGNYLAGAHDRQANEADAANEAQARQEAMGALQNFPTQQGTRNALPKALGVGQAGPERTPEMLTTRPEQGDVQGVPEQYRKSQDEYAGDLAKYAGGLDPSNPYLEGIQGKVLDKTMSLAGADYKLSSVMAQKDPVLLREFIAMNSTLAPGTPEFEAGLQAYSDKKYGTSAMKNAQATGLPVSKIMEWSQNPAKSARVTAELKRVDDSVPALYQEADALRLTGAARANHVAARVQELTNGVLSSLDNEFSLGGGQPAQQTSQMEVTNPNAPDFQEPNIPAGPMVQTPIRQPSDMQLSPIEIAEMQSAANQGNQEAIATLKKFGLPYNGPNKGKVLTKSVAATPVVTSPTGLVKSTGRQGLPAIDPAQLEADKTTSRERARLTIEEESSAKAALPQLDNIERNIDKLLTPDGTKINANLSNYIGPTNALFPKAVLGTATNEAGDVFDSLKSQITMLNLAGAKKAVGQSFGSMQVQEWDKFTDLLGRLNRDMTDKTALETITSIRKIIREQKPMLEEAIRGGRGQASGLPAGVTAKEWAHMTPEERAVFND